MSSKTLVHLLDRLEELKRPARAGDEARVSRLLEQLAKRKFRDSAELIRFHEILLFLSAYPRSARMLRRVAAILGSFPERVEQLRDADVDMERFRDPEISGIAGTSVTANFSYPVARWLVQRYPPEVEIDWEEYEDGPRLGQTLPRFIPLLEEEALVEASVPFTDWLDAATLGVREGELVWLFSRFESVGLSDKERAELYDSLNLYIHWRPRRYSLTRTGMRRRVRKVFYHDGPLLSRRDVSLAAELDAPPLLVEKLSSREGEAILDLIRTTSTQRYRELHGFTFGDPGHFVRADAGRGVELFVNGVVPEHRLPLRAYTSAFVFKNGVPVGYAEGLSLFERMEMGFNIYYTFRDGESAWLYARILRLFRQLLGVTAFSVDPYQIGFENEEGIESGAFWFYRKMGFRPVRAPIEKLVRAEERKIASRPGYRTSATTLRRISEGHMLFEIPPSTRSPWDRFHVRNLGLAVAREMARRFDGDALKMRRRAVATVERSLGVETSSWNDAEHRAFENLALVLSLIPNISRWTEEEKELTVRIVRAKAEKEESRFLRLLQRHGKLREEIISVGVGGR